MLGDNNLLLLPMVEYVSSRITGIPYEPTLEGSVLQLIWMRTFDVCKTSPYLDMIKTEFPAYGMDMSKQTWTELYLEDMQFSIRHSPIVILTDLSHSPLIVPYPIRCNFSSQKHHCVEECRVE